MKTACAVFMPLHACVTGGIMYVFLIKNRVISLFCALNNNR
jgi:hypothetical protein